MSILSSLQVYKGKYTLKDQLVFDEEDLSLISTCVVVESTQYEGKLSLCMTDSLGQLRYLPISEASALSIGDTPDPKSLIILVLGRAGSDDIMRVDLAA